MFWEATEASAFYHCTQPSYHKNNKQEKASHLYKQSFFKPRKYKHKYNRFKPFPFDDFRYSLTLFSKFFSSFLHSTFSLSVSRLYLALHGVYHALWAAVSSNSTLRKQTVYSPQCVDNRSLTFYAALFQATWTHHHCWHCFYRLQFPQEGFSFWAFPASLAVTEGILVSFFSSA